MKVQAAAQSSSSRDSTVSTEGPAGSGFEDGSSVLPLTVNGMPMTNGSGTSHLLPDVATGQDAGQPVVLSGSTNRQNGYPVPVPEGGSYRQAATVVRSRTSPSLS